MRQQVLKPVFLPVVSVSFVLAGAVSLKARASGGEISIKQSLAVAQQLSDKAKADEEETATEMQGRNIKREGDCCFFPGRAQKVGEAHGWSPQAIRDFLNADSSAEKPGGGASSAGGAASSKRGASGLE